MFREPAVKLSTKAVHGLCVTVYFRFNNRQDIGDKGRFELGMQHVAFKRLTYKELTGKELFGNGAATSHQ